MLIIYGINFELPRAIPHSKKPSIAPTKKEKKNYNTYVIIELKSIPSNLLCKFQPVFVILIFRKNKIGLYMRSLIIEYNRF